MVKLEVVGGFIRPTVEVEYAPTLTDRWLEHLADGRELSPRTVATYRDALADFCRRMDLDRPERANLTVLDRYRFRLKNAGLSVATRRLRLQGVVSFFRFAKSRGLIAEDPSLNLEIPNPRSFAPIPTFRGWEIERLVRSTPVVVTKGKREPETFFAKRKATAILTEFRDSALLALVYACGLRASEVAGLDRDDYDGHYVYLRGSKAARDVQKVGVMKRAQLEMTVYLDARDVSLWTLHPALFPPIYEMPTRTHSGSGLSADAVTKILAKRIARAGIEPRRRRLSPHTLRYSIATHFYELGYHPIDIARHLRHAGLQTLLRYVSQGSGLPKLRQARSHPWMLGKAFDSRADEQAV